MIALDEKHHSKGHKKASIVKLAVLLLTLLTLSLVFFKDKVSSEVATNNHLNGEKSFFDKALDLSNLEKDKCPLADPLTPTFKNYDLSNIVGNETFIDLAAEKLSGAIKINTSIGDQPPAPKDNIDYWASFLDFHEYLEQEFPLVHKKLNLEKVNEIGLLYKWEGTDPDLKPMLFMAHQDVVPVNEKTLDQWKYPAFSGYYDKEDQMIWGRGALDCKNLLIAELHTLEVLLEQGFVPKRTILLSFGFDEESSGVHGASSLSKHLLKTLGPDSLYSIIDEGAGFSKITDKFFIAYPILNEKGRVDVKITVDGHGGHSSNPPLSGHTNIGILAKVISLMEDTGFDNQYSEKNSLWQFLDCIAKYDEDLDPAFKEVILKRDVSSHYREKLLNILSSLMEFKDLIKTSQAFDIVSGGVKANALPEDAYAVVNHRIDFGSSVKKVLERDLAMARIIANTYDYGLALEGKVIIPETANGMIKVESFGDAVEPAPISPQNDVYEIFEKTIYNTFFNGVMKDNKDDITFAVSPNSVTMNTDTIYYWDLTRNIYRFQFLEFNPKVTKSLHSVNEVIDAKHHASTIGFLYDYILNVNEYHS
ncbi:unnamed protein product [Hanseniaspora opuntiae]